MDAWQVQDAKARFSEFLKDSLKKGPQIVTRRGVEEAVLISIDEWRLLCKAARPSLKELLLAEAPRFAIPVFKGPARNNLSYFSHGPDEQFPEIKKGYFWPGPKRGALRRRPNVRFT